MDKAPGTSRTGSQDGPMFDYPSMEFKKPPKLEKFLNKTDSTSTWSILPFSVEQFRLSTMLLTNLTVTIFQLSRIGDSTKDTMELFKD